MPKRRERRVPFAVPVRVTGVHRDGSPFTAAAQTIDISRHGVRLCNAHCLGNSKDLVVVQYKQRRARFVVTWRGSAHGADQGLAGLSVVPGQPALWGIDPGARPDEYQIPAASCADAALPAAAANPVASAPHSVQRALAGEKRAVRRFDCDRGVACWRYGEKVPIWGKLRDISARGCFVETPLAFEAETVLTLLFQLYGLKVRATGVVRAAGADGMGIQFRQVLARDVRKFVAALNRISDPHPSAYTSVGEPDSVLESVKAWFATHETLSGSDFARLLASSIGQLP